MSSEYVKLSVPEINYGDKNLLQSQLGLINVIKRFKEYEKLRKEELLLKITLKSKIEEIYNSFAFFDKLLPKIAQKTENRLFPEQIEDQSEEMHKKLSLDQELNDIKRRLAKLQ